MSENTASTVADLEAQELEARTAGDITKATRLRTRIGVQLADQLAATRRDRGITLTADTND